METDAVAGRQTKRRQKRLRSTDSADDKSETENDEGLDSDAVVSLRLLEGMPEMTQNHRDKRGRRGAVFVSADSEAWMDGLSNALMSGAGSRVREAVKGSAAGPRGTGRRESECRQESRATTSIGMQQFEQAHESMPQVEDNTKCPSRESENIPPPSTLCSPQRPACEGTEDTGVSAISTATQQPTDPGLLSSSLLHLGPA